MRVVFRFFITIGVLLGLMPLLAAQSAGASATPTDYGPQVTLYSEAGSAPSDVATDQYRNVWVAANGAHKVVQLSLTGDADPKVIPFSVTLGDGLTLYKNVEGGAYRPLYIAEKENSRIWAYADGQPEAYQQSQFGVGQPTDIDFDGSDKPYIMNDAFDRISRYNGSSLNNYEVFPQPTSSIAYDGWGLKLYYSEPSTNRVMAFDLTKPAGTPATEFAPLAGMLDGPTGIAVDGSNKNLYVSDTNHNRVIRVALDQTDPTKAVTITPTEGLNKPTGITYFRGGLYIADTGNDRVVVLPQRSAITYSVGGSMNFGDSAHAKFDTTLMSGTPESATLSGTAVCTKTDDGKAINDTLAPGYYAIDETSCSGLSLKGLGAPFYELTYGGNFFKVDKTPIDVTITGSATVTKSTYRFTHTETLPTGVTVAGTATCTRTKPTESTTKTIDNTYSVGTYAIDASSCTGLSLSGANAANYSLTIKAGDYVVGDAKTLEITLNGFKYFEVDTAAPFSWPYTANVPEGVTISGGPGQCTKLLKEDGTSVSVGDNSLELGTYPLDLPTCFGYYLSGVNADDYKIVYKGTFSVVKPKITITVKGSKTYGDNRLTFSETQSGARQSGYATGKAVCTGLTNDNVMLTANAGTYKIDPSTCSGHTLAGANASKFDLEYVGDDFVVNKQNLVFYAIGHYTYRSPSSNYWSLNTGTLPAGIKAGTALKCTKTTDGKTIDDAILPGDYSVDVTSCTGWQLQDGPNNDNYFVFLSGGSFTMHKTLIKIVINGTMPYGSTTPTYTFTTQGKPDGITIAGTITCTSTLAGGAIGANLNVGLTYLNGRNCSGLSMTGTDADTYEMQIITASVNVTKRELPVAVTGTKTVDGNAIFKMVPDFSSVPEIPGFSTSGNVTCSKLTNGKLAKDERALGSYTIDLTSCSGLAASPTDSNFKFVFSNGAFTVTKNLIQVQVSGSHAFGETPSLKTENWYKPTAINVVGTITCTAMKTGEPLDSTLPIGSYTVDPATCSGLSLTGGDASNVLSNYDIEYAADFKYVVQTPVTIAVTGVKTYKSTTTLSKVVTGETDAVTVTGTLACTKLTTGTAIADAKKGSYTIDAKSCSGLSLIGEGAANYKVIYTGGAFTVNPQAVAVVFSGSQTYLGSATYKTKEQNPMPVDVTLVGTPTCMSDSTLAVGDYTLDADDCSGVSLGGDDADNYAFQGVGGDFTVNPIEVKVTVTGTQLYGNPASFAHTETLPSGITISGEANCASATDGAIDNVLNVGNHKIAASSCSGLTLGGTDVSNYKLVYVGGAHIVLPVTVDVTVTGSAIYSDGATFAHTETLPEGMTISGTAKCTGVTAANPASPLNVGSYMLDATTCSGLTLGGTNADKYTIVWHGGAFSVTKKAITIAAQPATRAYGVANPTFTVDRFPVGGLSNGPTFTTNATASSVPGTYVLTPNGTAGPNFTVSFTNSTLTITKARPTVTMTVPSSAAFGANTALAATVTAPGTGTPSGTVSFFDGATNLGIARIANGVARITVNTLGGGARSITGVYSGDSNFTDATSKTATVNVGGTTTLTGNQKTITATKGSVVVSNAVIRGTVNISRGATLSIENSRVDGVVTISAAGNVRICGTTFTKSVTITSDAGWVVAGDAAHGCAPNRFESTLTLKNNARGIQVIGNYLAGRLINTGNSGAGPWADAPVAVIKDNKK